MSATIPLPDPTPTMPRLEGARVRLRGLDDDDLGALFALYSDPKVTRYWSHRAWHLESQAREYVERAKRGFAERTFLQWGMALAESNRVIGTVTLFGFVTPHRRCELGYALGSGDWGRGYAREALALALDYAFGPLHLYRVEADIDPRNLASIHLVERLGFKHEGLLRGRYHVGSEIQDSAIYGLLAQDWVKPAPREMR